MKYIILIFMLLTGTETMAHAKEQKVIEAGGFVHSVFFWLKNPNNESEQEAFEKYLSTFINNSIYVKSKHIGKMAPSKRDVVDSSYDYALVVTFASAEEQAKYQQEPVHLKFVDEAAHLWSKVVVYDSISIY